MFQGRECAVYFDDGKGIRYIRCEFLRPVMPQIGHNVRIIYGLHSGTRGTVVAMNGDVAEIGTYSDMRNVPVQWLCKLA